MFRSELLVLSVLLTTAVAGPNEDAQLFFDAIAATDKIDADGPCAEDSTLVTAVRISDAAALYSYEFYISFDTASLTFVSGKRDNRQYTNFLELNDGSCSFSARLSRTDSTRILVSNFLSGSDENQCVSDSGVLGLFTFRHTKEDTTTIAIESIKLIDCDLEEDLLTEGTDARIIPPDEDPIRYFSARKSPGTKVSYRNGTVNITFERKTRYSVLVVNTLGKKLVVQEGYGSRYRYIPSSGHGVGESSRMRILRICYAGNELVLPLVQ